MKLADIRRDNLRELMRVHSASGLSEMLGYRQPTFLSQMAGPNPTRVVTEKTARNYEKKLGLEAGALDIPMGDADPAPTAAAAESKAASGELVADVIRLVGTICADEKVNLPTMKFADVVALAFIDTMEHEQTPRPDHIKQLVRLLK